MKQTDQQKSPNAVPQPDNGTVMTGEIEDATTYEWGMLTKEGHQTGAIETAPWSPTRAGNWQGGSLSWSGALFRRDNKRAIKTFRDFLSLNPLNLPTNKTFFFFKITVDQDGNRKRILCYEGTFSDPKSQAIKDSMRGAKANAMSDAGVPQPRHGEWSMTLPHPMSTESRSLRDTMERSIADLQRELDVCRRERDMYREQNERLRNENEANRQSIISIEGERIRYQVEKDALEKAHRMELDRLIADHEREIDQLETEHTRELADAKISAEKSAIQTLNDGISPSAKLMDGIGKLLQDAPKYMEVIGTVAGLIKSAQGAQGGAPQYGNPAMMQQGSAAANPSAPMMASPFGPPPDYPSGADDYSIAEASGGVHG
jgi:hypothetical protein